MYQWYGFEAQKKTVFDIKGRYWHLHWPNNTLAINIFHLLLSFLELKKPSTLNQLGHTRLTNSCMSLEIITEAILNSTLSTVAPLFSAIKFSRDSGAINLSSLVFSSLLLKNLISSFVQLLIMGWRKQSRPFLGWSSQHDSLTSAGNSICKTQSVNLSCIYINFNVQLHKPQLHPWQPFVRKCRDGCKKRKLSS